MARLRTRKVNGVAYYELAWSGPDADPATGKKARHTQSLGRRDSVPRKLADEALDALRRQLFSDKHGISRPAAPTCREWADEYLRWHAAQWPSSHYRTSQVLEQHVLPGWEFKHLSEVTDADVEEKVTAWRAAEYKDQSITKHLRVLRAFFNRAIEKGRLERSPADTVPDPQILDSAPHLFYEADELEALYLASSFDPHHPDDPQHATWHAPAWKLLANTGMRRGEALIAKCAWVRGDRLRVVSTGEERTKSGKWREIPLGPGAVEGLQGLDEALGENREYLLPRVAPPSLSRAAAKCITRADLPGSLHTLRHTFISHLAMNPAIAIRDIQLWAGHESIETTERYMYLRSSGGLALAL